MRSSFPSLAPPGSIDLLVLASHAPELRGIRDQLGDRLHGSMRGISIGAKTVGVGMAAAGGSAAKRVLQLAPRAVVHLGTVGIYPGLSQYRPHDVVVADRLVLADQAVIDRKASFPGPMQTEFTPHAMIATGLAAQGPRTFRASVAVPLASTATEDAGRRVAAATGCHAENLEAASIAHACHLADVPYAGVFGVTHVVGPTATEDWQQFERASAIAAAEVILKWVLAGAQGLPHVKGG
jgi:nucleoside phosphorylase